MVLGMVVGMVVGTRLQSVRGGSDGTPGKSAAGPRAVISAGYVVIAIALAIGAFTTLSSSTWYTLAWVAVSGLGFGLVMPAAMNVTLASLTAEGSGSGSALISAMRQVGSVIGVAILGTLISDAYGSRVDTTGLPAAAADLARTGVAGGVEVAHELGSTELTNFVLAVPSTATPIVPPTWRIAVISAEPDPLRSAYSAPSAAFSAVGMARPSPRPVSANQVARVQQVLPAAVPVPTASAATYRNTGHDREAAAADKRLAAGTAARRLQPLPDARPDDQPADQRQQPDAVASESSPRTSRKYCGIA